MLYEVITDGPEHGTLALDADGSFVYTPDKDYNINYGPDGFTYKASDGTDESELISVAINVTPVSDPPRPEYDEYTVDANGTIKITFVPGPPDEADEMMALLFAFATDPNAGSVSLVDDEPAIEYAAGSTVGTYTIESYNFV